MYYPFLMSEKHSYQTALSSAEAKVCKYLVLHTIRSITLKILHKIDVFVSYKVSVYFFL